MTIGKKLDMKPHIVEGDNKRANMTAKLKNYLKDMEMMIENVDLSRQEFMLRRMHEMLNPNTSSLVEPSVPTRTRGRPKATKKKGSTKRDPSAFELTPSQIDSCSPSGGVVYATGPYAPTPMFTSTMPARPVKQRVSWLDNINISFI